jgi:hypothetical protein
MARYNNTIIKDYLKRGNNGKSNADKGKAFEDLICYIFKKIPGIEITLRNHKNAFHTEEIDIAVWNNRKVNGLHFHPNIILVECKNWSAPVSSIEVSWFGSKLESRGQSFGILIANKGITGRPEDLTMAHQVLSKHLERGRKIILVTSDELVTLLETKDVIDLIKTKLCILAASGTID